MLSRVKSRLSIAVALPARAERALKICSRGVTGVHNNERFARAGKANVNGNGLIPYKIKWPYCFKAVFHCSRFARAGGAGFESLLTLSER